MSVFHIWVPAPGSPKPALPRGHAEVISPETARDRVSARALSNRLRLRHLLESGGVYADYDLALTPAQAAPLEAVDHLVVARQGILNNCLLAAPAADPAVAWLLEYLPCPWGQMEINRILPFCPHPWAAVDLRAAGLAHKDAPRDLPPVKSGALSPRRGRDQGAEKG
jgi:hypothetical protein